jgi:glycerophosphoryl diester phosphodiesterase
LENTIESIEASIKLGANVVEIDIQPTKDGEFAVFHDWTLECRTNGTGRTRDHRMSYLKSLDIGYGYTADQGKSFPFRGKAIGQMPSLREVLAEFPKQPLLINIKSNDPTEGERLAAYLAELTDARRNLIAVYGGQAPINVIRERLPGSLSMSRDSLKSCLARYFLVGWSGAIPESCERTLVLVPINYSKWLWGWPETFIRRMESVGSAVFVAGAYHGGVSHGIDSVEELNQLPQGYKGGIWTNEIELISRAITKSNRSASDSN